MSADKRVLFRGDDISVNESNIGEYLTLVSEGGNITADSVTIDGIKNLSLLDSPHH